MLKNVLKFLKEKNIIRNGKKSNYKKGSKQPLTSDKKTAKKEGGDRSGFLVPAGIFIGMGLGFLLGNLVAYLFIGLGVGFALLFLTKK